jgi:short-subunit dehydrogenase
LAAPGAILTICGRNEEKLQQLATLLQEKGAIVRLCCSDLSTMEGVDHLCSAVANDPPCVLINNAGIGRYGLFVDVPIEQSISIVNVNVLAPMRITYAWCHACQKAGIHGKVVFISSVADHFPMPGSSTYAASKAFLSSFAEALRWELSPHEVLTICPGPFASAFQERAAGCSQNRQRISASSIAIQITKLIEKGSGVHFLGKWKWFRYLAACIPKSCWMPFVKKEILSRPTSHGE